jgi:hypothetical protein
MKLLKTLSSPAGAAAIGASIFLFAQPAWANQPPGPHMLLAEVLILPIMIILTTLGGGYAVLQAGNKNPRKKNGSLKVLLVILVIFFSAISEGLGMLLTVAFGVIALVRGVKMILWGLSASRQNQEPNTLPAKSNPNRLIPAGVILVLAAIGLGATGPAFIGWWPEGRISRTEGDLKDLVAYQILTAKEQAKEGGAIIYEKPLSDEGRLGSKDHPTFDKMKFNFLYWKEGNRFQHYQTVFQLGPEAKSFKVWVVPFGLPFFPYNHLTSLPSFYADQTGAIRMVRVHDGGEKCPEDAPVYYQVGQEDFKRVAERLRTEK